MANFANSGPDHAVILFKSEEQPSTLHVRLLSSQPLNNHILSLGLCMSRRTEMSDATKHWPARNVGLEPLENLEAFEFGMLKRIDNVISSPALFGSRCEFLIPKRAVAKSRMFKVGLYRSCKNQRFPVLSSMIRYLRNSPLCGRSTRSCFGFLLSDLQIEQRVQFLDGRFAGRLQHEWEYDALMNCYMKIVGGYDTPLI